MDIIILKSQLTLFSPIQIIQIQQHTNKNAKYVINEETNSPILLATTTPDIKEKTPYAIVYRIPFGKQNMLDRFPFI